MKPLKLKRSELGLTLLESLVAMLILQIMLAFMTPPLLLAIATRIQNQKTQQALNLAQAEVDRVRLLTERADAQTTFAVITKQLPPEVPVATATDPTLVGPPNSATQDANCASDRSLQSITGWCPLQPNEPSRNTQLVMQSFRTDVKKATNTTATLADDTPTSFRLGVRIYTRESMRYAPSGTLRTQPARLGATSPGNSNTSGGNRFTRAPLVVLYVRISRTDYGVPSDSSLNQYCKNLGGTTVCTQN